MEDKRQQLIRDELIKINSQGKLGVIAAVSTVSIDILSLIIKDSTFIIDDVERIVLATCLGVTD